MIKDDNVAKPIMLGYKEIIRVQFPTPYRESFSIDAQIIVSLIDELLYDFFVSHFIVLVKVVSEEVVYRADCVGHLQQ